MENDNIIRYDLIAQALDFYKGLGYREINVPWHVRTEVSDITCPSPDRAYPFENGVLVGSAEQSMIQMALDGELVQGLSYVTVTPCFRNEPELDRYHQKYFMKVELFHFGINYQAYRLIRHDAFQFLKSLTAKTIDVVEYDGRNSDMEIDGVEIGSYNFRSMNGVTWTCGTGLALPRFTKVM
jgi:hypothetical protein